MSEERQKKSEAAWKAEEDEESNKSSSFVELTEYVANAVEHDTHFFILAKLHKLYSLTYKGTHLAVPPVLVFQARLVPQSTTCCFWSASTCVFLFSSLLFLTWTKGDRIDATLHLFTTVVISISNLIATRTQSSFFNSSKLSKSVL